MIELTLQDVMSMAPCTDYNRDLIEGFFDGRQSVGLDYILGLYLPAEDLLWLLLREPFLDEEQLIELAGQYFDDLRQDLITHPDSRVQEAVRLTQTASAGDVGPEHIRQPENPDANQYYGESTRGMLAASYSALWAAVATARAHGGDEANAQRHLQVHRALEKIGVYHG